MNDVKLKKYIWGELSLMIDSIKTWCQNVLPSCLVNVCFFSVAWLITGGCVSVVVLFGLFVVPGVGMLNMVFLVRVDRG